jgi:hypothetical protein
MVPNLNFRNCLSTWLTLLYNPLTF